MGIDVKYYLRSGWWSTFGEVGQAGAGLIVAVIFARWASQEVFGQFQLIVSILATVAVVSLKGLDTVLVRDVARGNEGVYAKVAGLRWRWSLISVPILLGISAYYWKNGEAGLAGTLLIAVILAPGHYVGQLWGGYYKGKKRWRSYSWMSLMRSGFSLVVVGSVIVLSGGKLIWIFLAHYALNIAINVGYLKYSLEKTDNERISEDWREYGLFLSKLGVLKVIATNIDKVLVGILISPAALAVYTIGLMVPSYVGLFVKSLLATTSPKLAGRGSLTFKELMMMFGAGIFFSGATVIAVWVLVIPLFGPAYAEARLLGYIAALAMLAHPVGVYLVNFANMTGRKNVLMTCNIVCPIIKITLLLVLGSRWQEVGFVSVYAIMALMWVIVPLTVMKIDWRNMRVA